MRFSALFAAALLSLCPWSASAQAAQSHALYRCTASDGSIVFTSMPQTGCVVIAVARTPGNQQTSTQSAKPDATLVEHGGYTNHDGVAIHRPAHTVSGSAPAGASAQCRDGSYSFSTHHSGTCSHHGGVAQWL
ncbi:DUF3761 domain-containing protein [Dyella japonica]|uniref:DUF3761 domain-containing protein n=1 Tax=Dyella japonica TaxID=231455 RepID=UPI0033951FF5